MQHLYSLSEMYFWVYKHIVFLQIMNFRQKMLMMTHHQLRGGQFTK